MKRAIQTLIFSAALPALAASASNLENNNLDSQSGRQNTNAPNFVRLVIMRLIYGIASTMGLEDRLEDTFNGAFIPPSADNLFDIGGGDGDGDGEGLLSNIFDGDDYL
ncbi:uncharacterized protein LOC111594393 [Drosophila hydei]|uniref:Uncharacterized protein LOC111594393 n=1 Tax=Drosophila hydei TaxID=7224 RepID=A0A6J1LJC9_DROHY|nr:uncharacterized protein LOC111594393 [Drosophila hydei]